MEIRSFPYTHSKFADSQNAMFELRLDNCAKMRVNDCTELCVEE